MFGQPRYRNRMTMWPRLTQETWNTKEQCLSTVFAASYFTFYSGSRWTGDSKSQLPAQRKTTRLLAVFKLRTKIKLTEYKIPDIKCQHPTDIMKTTN